MSGAGRQDPRGGAPPPRGEGDDLLGLAYGELDGATERAVRARVAGDPILSERLADMERVRSMFSAMEDEDPPPGLSAQLLAHAAQVARPAAREAARSGEGFWARLRAWMAPIAAHPGLAAAASILLVAGVAGVLVARNGPDLGRSEYQAAHTTASPAADPAPGPVGGVAASSPPSEAPAAAPEPTAENAALEDGEFESQTTTKADDAVASKGVAARPSRRNRDAAKPLARAEESPAPASSTGAALGLRDGVEDAKTSKPADRAEPAPAKDKEKAGKDESADEDARGDVAAQAPAATTPASPPPAPQSDSSGSAGPAQNQSAPASVAELHKRALTAASSRRCLEVQSIDRTIRGLDPKYSDSVFRSDRRLATCLPAVKRAKRAK